MVTAREFFNKNQNTVKGIQQWKEFKTSTWRQVSTMVPEYSYSLGLQLPLTEYITAAPSSAHAHASLNLNPVLTNSSRTPHYSATVGDTHSYREAMLGTSQWVKVVNSFIIRETVEGEPFLSVYKAEYGASCRSASQTVLPPPPTIANLNCQDCLPIIPKTHISHHFKSFHIIYRTIYKKKMVASFQ